MTTVRGIILTVRDVAIGDVLVSDHEAGVTELIVNDAYDFAEEGGQLRIGDETITYTGIDDDTDTVILDGATQAEWPEGTDVVVLPETSEKIAIVQVADDGDAVEVRIPAIWYPMVADAIRDPEARHLATLRYFDDEYELVDIPNAPKALDAGTLTGALPDDVALDESPPEVSPDAVVVPSGVGGVRVSWDAVPRARFYDVFASLTPGVTAESTYVGTSSGSSLAFDRLDGIRLPMEGELVYAAIVARNDADSAPIGVEGSAAPRKADLFELNVEQLNANIVEALTGVFGALTADIAFIGGRLTLGNVEVSHIVLDPAVGLVFYGPDGKEVLGKLDITEAQQSELTLAILTAAQATISGLEMHGAANRFMNDGRVTMMSAVADPVQPPTLSVGLGSRPWLAPPTNYAEYGMFWEASTSRWWQLLWRQETNACFARAIDADGEIVGTSVQFRNLAPRGGTDVGVDAPSGVVKVGSNFYMLRRRKAGDVGMREWMLVKYGSTGDPVDAVAGKVIADENNMPDHAPYPVIGYDGTNLVVGSTTTSTPLVDAGAGGVGFARYNTSLTLVDAFTKPSNIGTGNFARGCGIASLPGFGGPVFWIAQTPTTGSEIRFFTFAGGVLTPHTTRPLLLLEGMNYNVGYDGAHFMSSLASTTLKIYSDYFAAPGDSRTFWAQYAWEAGASATLPSEQRSKDLPDGRYLNIGNLAPGPGTTTTRVFTGNGPSAPDNGNMFSRGTTAAGNMQISSVATAGANPRTETDFLTGTPFELVSQAGDFLADGAGNFAAPRKQRAGIDVPVPSGTSAVSVTFDPPMGGVPAIHLSANDAALTGYTITAKSAAGFTVLWTRTDAGSFNWIAMVP